MQHKTEFFGTLSLSSSALGPIGSDFSPDPFVVSVVLVTRPQDRLARLGLESKALAQLGVVHLLLLDHVLPRTVSRSHRAPRDLESVTAAVFFRTPLSRGQLAFGVEPEQLVTTIPVASRGSNLKQQ